MNEHGRPRTLIRDQRGEKWWHLSHCRCKSPPISTHRLCDRADHFFVTRWPDDTKCRLPCRGFRNPRGSLECRNDRCPILARTNQKLFNGLTQSEHARVGNDLEFVNIKRPAALPSRHFHTLTHKCLQLLFFGFRPSGPAQ